MINLTEQNINGVRFLASDDFQYVIELSGNTYRGVDVSSMEEVALDCGLTELTEEMSKAFQKDFHIKERKELTAKEVKSKADRLRSRGYSCVYDIVDSSITILSRDGKTVYSAVGDKVDWVIQSFEGSSASLDSSISIEDYCLATFL